MSKITSKKKTSEQKFSKIKRIRGKNQQNKPNKGKKQTKIKIKQQKRR